jgi:flavin reductase (DIM6/NTAB) family NADH-FMN oxidoreductase RutF
MRKRALSLSAVYRVLEPGPVVLLTTAHRGRTNVMAMSWHTMMEFEPPLVGCLISGRCFSFELLRTTRQCAINVPTVELANKVVACGNSSGRRTDKFATFALTAVPASAVDVPLIDECYANLECRLVDSRLVNKYNFFILEVVKAWIDTAIRLPRTLHHRGRGLFMVAGRNMQLPSRMK